MHTREASEEEGGRKKRGEALEERGGREKERGGLGGEGVEGILSNRVGQEWA